MDDAQRRAWEALDLGPVWVRRGGAAPHAGSTGPSADVPAVEFHVVDPAPVEASLSGGAGVGGLDWAGLRAAVEGCRACGLCESRTRTVFGVGDPSARWMFVGEAPGAEEDLRGEPFVGQAGKLLDSMLGALGLDRGRDVFIANVLKCRPPGNRNPEPEEVARCEPYLQRQVTLVRPRVIVAMGRFAVQSLLGTDAAISSLRGAVHRYRTGDFEVPLVVTYHPAYLLRSLADKSKAWSDLCLARRCLETGEGSGRA